MQRTANLSSDSRNQLVPSPGSPLALETWCMADLESWLCDSTTLLRSNNCPIVNSHNTSSGPQLQEDLMAASKILPYQHHHHAMHVSVPSPSSAGPLAAESPTLYESPPPPPSSTMPPKGFAGPPPYVQVKREIEDVDYHCGGGTLNGGVSMNHLQNSLSMDPLIVVKKEGEDARNNHNGNEDICLSRDKIEQVRLLAVEQAAKDIHEACRVLRISPDPTQWSLRDVKSWFLWTANQYGIEPMCLQRLPDCLDGAALCSLSEQYFRLQVPNGGDILHAQLEIWITAAQIQNHGSQSLIPFRPEDSMLDMSSILNQWTNNTNNNNNSSSNSNINQQQHSPPSFHRMSPPAGSRGVLMETSSVSSPDVGQDFSSEGMQSDDEISDESCDVERAPGTNSSGGRQGSHSHIHLWQFLKELLSQPHLFGSCIRWLDRPKGIFKIEDSVRVARLWGKRKNRPAMNYDKLSRSIRQYYKKGIMKKTERSQRLVYQFCHPYGL